MRTIAVVFPVAAGPTEPTGRRREPILRRGLSDLGAHHG
jgi:hypothetical protein